MFANQPTLNFRTGYARRGASTVALALIAGTILMFDGEAAAAFDLPHHVRDALPADFEVWEQGPVDRTGGDRNKAVGEEPASLVVYRPFSAVDARVRTRFRLSKGWPSAGVAIRVRSPADYYLVKVSAPEQRLSLLHIAGHTTEVIAEVDADVAQDHWQSLQVLAHGEGFEISLDDRWVLTGFDHGQPARGRFGVWSAGSGLASFDQVDISPMPPEE